jgi:cyanophycin synthetase
LAHIKGITRYNWTLQRQMYRLVINCALKPYVSTLGVPIIAVTGTNGKTTVARILERVYLDAGYHVGVCTTAGVSHDGTMVWKGDASWALGVWKAARCPDLNLLILETARGGIVKYGLGFKRCQVGIVTNLYEDHLGFDKINTLHDMVEVKALIPRHTDRRGSVILNGDDPLVCAMADKTLADPIYFVREEDHRRFDKVFFVKERSIYKKISHNEAFVANIHEMPMTLQGLLDYNITNWMTVFAALEGMKVFIPLERDSIERTMRVMGSSPYDNSERFCLVTFKGEKVVLSFSKNPESYRRDIRIIEKIKENGGFSNLVGVLTGPGNRQEKYFKDISEIVAPVCDFFFIRPPKPKYLRGRTEDEIVKLLSYHIPEDKILSTRRTSLSEVISLAKQRLSGKTLYVVFLSIADADIDFLEVLREADLEPKLKAVSSHQSCL